MATHPIETSAPQIECPEPGKVGVGHKCVPCLTLDNQAAGVLVCTWILLQVLPKGCVGGDASLAELR
jgi:hypothetical protein